MSNATIRINLIDLNDNAPEFPVGSLTASINENNSPNVLVTTLQPVDPDAGANGAIVSIEFVTPHPLFSIDSSTGAVTVLALLDREVADEYIIDVIARDGGSPSLVTTGSLVISVIDVNDNAPEFASDTISIPLSARFAIEGSIRTLAVSDADAGDNAIVDFAITGGLLASLFGLQNSTDLTTDLVLVGDASLLPDEVFTLTVTATDRGTPSMSSAVTLEILRSESPLIHFETTPYISPLQQVFNGDIVTQTLGPDVTNSAVEVSTTVGNFSYSGSYDHPAPIPSTLNLVVATPDVYKDPAENGGSRVFQFSVQVLSDVGGTITEPVTIIAAVEASDNPSLQLLTTCVINSDANAPQGVCVMSVSIPDLWFFTTSVRTITVDAQASQYPGVQTSGTGLLRPSNLNINPSSVLGEVYPVILSRGVFSGTQFTVPVLGHASNSVLTFEVVMTFGNGVKFVSAASSTFVILSSVTNECLSAVNQDGSPCEETVRITGTRSGNLPQDVTDPDRLFEVDLFARTTSVDVMTAVGLEVNLFVDGQENHIYPSGLPSSYPYMGSAVDRFGPHVRDSGTVFVLAANMYAGLFVSLGNAFSCELRCYWRRCPVHCRDGLRSC